MAVRDTIRIHRQKPVVYVAGKPVKLTKDEHYLLVALGVSDNRLVPHEVLLDVMCEGRVQIPADKFVLWNKVDRLRKKVGTDTLRSRREFGYILSGDVQFVG